MPFRWLRNQPGKCTDRAANAYGWYEWTEFIGLDGSGCDLKCQALMAQDPAWCRGYQLLTNPQPNTLPPVSCQVLAIFTFCCYLISLYDDDVDDDDNYFVSSSNI
jgi:hypothetical protein